jgi:aspartate/tyrosine/aromatic aminotransferase
MLVVVSPVQHPILCQSFAKNMGLYGERVGALHMVCKSQEEAAALLSNVKQRVIRPNYSSPPRHGAAVAAEVLSSPDLSAEWREELLAMAQRIQQMRSSLRAELERLGAVSVSGDWSHIETQIGMFAFTGLSQEQVRSLRSVEHVYLTEDGRMSLAGLSEKHVEYVAAGMKRVTQDIES